MKPALGLEMVNLVGSKRSQELSKHSKPVQIWLCFLATNSSAAHRQDLLRDVPTLLQLAPDTL